MVKCLTYLWEGAVTCMFALNSVGCSSRADLPPASPSPMSQPTATTSTQVVTASPVTPYGVERLHPVVLATYPHDTTAFTEGLVYAGNFLYESTGQYGASTLRKVDIETGQVVESMRLPS